MSEQNPNEAPDARESDTPSTPATPTAPATPGAPPASPAPAAPTAAASPTTPPASASTSGEAVPPPAATPAPDGTAAAGDEVWLYEEEGDIPSGPSTGVAATFLPGIDATAVIAAILSVLAAGVYVLVYPLVQAKSGAANWDNYRNNVPQAKQDPFITERYWSEYQSWGHITLGLLAVVVALVVLGLWTYEKNKLWSRSVAQAALVIGLAVVVYGILMKTGVIAGSLPSTKQIQDVYSQKGSQ